MIDPVVRTVANLIKLRGGPLKMSIATTGVYNPDTSTVDNVVVDYTVQALVLDAKESLAMGSLVKAGDKQVFIKPDPVNPKPEQGTTELTISGEVFKVYLVKPLNPSDSKVIYYEVYARR